MTFRWYQSGDEIDGLLTVFSPLFSKYSSVKMQYINQRQRVKSIMNCAKSYPRTIQIQLKDGDVVSKISLMADTLMDQCTT